MTAAPVVERDPARRAHRETRRLVMRDGADAPRLLYEAFDAYNAAHFGGQLGAPMIWISQTSSPRALGDYTSRDVHGLQSRIRIAPATWKRGTKRALAVLLHEMVHAWCAEVLKDGEPGYKGHGPLFAAKCNEIGREYGWPECSPKGRGGKTRAECWPVVQLDENDHGVVRAPKVDDGPELPPEAPEAPPAPTPDEAPVDVAEARGVTRERARVARYLAALAGSLRTSKKGRSAALIERVWEDFAAGRHETLTDEA